MRQPSLVKPGASFFTSLHFKKHARLQFECLFKTHNKFQSGVTRDRVRVWFSLSASENEVSSSDPEPSPLRKYKSHGILHF